MTNPTKSPANPKTDGALRNQSIGPEWGLRAQRTPKLPTAIAERKTYSRFLIPASPAAFRVEAFSSSFFLAKSVAGVI